MTTCPRCKSTDCRSNAIANLSFGEATSIFIAARRSGHATYGVRTMLGWVGVEFANVMRLPWLCQYCGLHFA